MWGQCGLDLLEDDVWTERARLGRPPLHAATFQHQPRPHVLIAGLRKRLAQRGVEDVSIRRFPLWKEHLLQLRRDGDKAVRSFGLESALDSNSAGEVDVLLDVYLIDGKTRISPLKPQRFEVPSKIRQYFVRRIFQQPKGLVVCELQAAGTSVLS